MNLIKRISFIIGILRIFPIPAGNEVKKYKDPGFNKKDTHHYLEGQSNTIGMPEMKVRNY